MNNTVYYIGQIAGILVTIGVIVNLQLKKKQQMYVLSIILNILSAINILLLDGFCSGVIICLVADIQIAFAWWHDRKQTEIHPAEKIIFFAMYLAGGLVGFRSGLDVLSIIAAALYMFAMFQKKEQNIRLFLLGNMATWTVYHGILGSTAIFAQLAGITSSVIALIRYRKK